MSFAPGLQVWESGYDVACSQANTIGSDHKYIGRRRDERARARGRGSYGDTIGYLWEIQRSLTVIVSILSLFVSKLYCLLRFKPPQLCSWTGKRLVRLWNEAKCPGVAVSWVLRYTCIITTTDCYADCLQCLWMNIKIKVTPVVPKYHQREKESGRERPKERGRGCAISLKRQTVMLDIKRLRRTQVLKG